MEIAEFLKKVRKICDDHNICTNKCPLVHFCDRDVPSDWEDEDIENVVSTVIAYKEAADGKGI